MRFDQERDALDGGGVGPLSALRQALFDQAGAGRRASRCGGRGRTRRKNRRGSRWQLAACANIRASVNFPTPRGPENSMACGTRSPASMPRSAVTMRALPRNSEKPITMLRLPAYVSLDPYGHAMPCPDDPTVTFGSIRERMRDSTDPKHGPMDLFWRIQNAGPVIVSVQSMRTQLGSVARRS